MTTEQIIAVASLAATILGGLATVLRYSIQLAKLIKSNSDALLVLEARLDVLSTKVLGRHTPSG